MIASRVILRNLGRYYSTQGHFSTRNVSGKAFNMSLWAPSAQRRLGSLSLTYDIDMHSRFWPDIGSGAGRWAKIPLRCQ